MNRLLCGLTGAALAVATAGPASADELVVYAAGSLREAMTQIARDFPARTGTVVRTEFGPSRVMRERIEKGKRVDLLASADMGHPLRLERIGQASAVAMFTRNSICALSTARVGLTTASLLDILLDPGIKLGTAAAGTDPLEGQLANLTVTPLPDNLRVGPEYGMALRKGAHPQAAALMLYILSPAAQAALAQHGFTPVALPTP